MALLDLMEPQKQLGAGVIATALIAHPSAPGVVSRDELMLAQLKEHQPSGCEHLLKYWAGFTPVRSYRNAAVPTVLCGSGGDSVVTRLIKVTDQADTADDDDAVAPLSHNQTIAAIRAALSLQIKELAEILRVRRPTIYSWINEESQPSATNRVRLQQVYRVASKWNRYSHLPTEHLVRGVGADGQSVLDLLEADEIDELEIVKRFEGLAAERMKMQAEANEQRPTAESIARKHGLAPKRVSDQQHLIDAFTGKRSHPD